MKPTIMTQVLAVLQSTPNLKAAEVAPLVPQRARDSVVAECARLARLGYLVSTGEVNHKRYSLSPTPPVPAAKPVLSVALPKNTAFNPNVDRSNLRRGPAHLDGAPVITKATRFTVGPRMPDPQFSNTHSR